MFIMFITVWICVINILSISNVGQAVIEMSEQDYYNDLTFKESSSLQNYSIFNTNMPVHDYYEEYRWNKSISPIKYYLTICKNVCLQERHVTFIADDRFWGIQCYPCDCQKSQCLIYGTCCPEVYSISGNDSGNTLELLDHDVFNTTFTFGNKKTLTCGQSERNSIEYVLISSCPDDFLDSTVNDLCEKDLHGKDLGFGDQLIIVHTRVSDPKTGVAYKNRYCAECNNITNIMTWKKAITCQHYLYVYKSTSPSELLEQSLHLDSTCRVIDQPPDNTSNFFSCDIRNSWFLTPIDKCNITGLWTEYDPDVRQYCHSMPGYSLTVKKDYLYYANIFCAICNSKTYPTLTNEGGAGGGGPGFDTELPFTMLLHFHDTTLDSSANIVGCPTGQWSGPGTRCFPKECTKGKILENDTCITALPEIRGLGYTIRQVYEFSDNTGNMSTRDPQMFIRNVSEGLKQWYNDNLILIVQESLFQFNITFSSYTNMTNNSLETVLYFPSYLSLEARFIAKSSHTRDEAEIMLIEQLTKENIVLVVDNTTVHLKYLYNYINSSNDLNCSITTNTCLQSEYIKISHEIMDNPMWYSQEDFLLLHELLVCPYVRFDKFSPQVKVIMKQKHIYTINLVIGSITLFIEDVSLTFKDKTELMRMSLEDDGSLYVCVDSLNTILENYYRQQKEKTSKVYISLYVITVVCLGVSMVCLVLTLITYFCFQTLRSVAGINNIFLSATLLFSQALVLTASHLKAPSTICTLIGVGTHYMWLCMFSWSLLCCFHMYRIFTAKNRTTYSIAHLRKQLVLKIAFSLLVPAFIVATVILVDYYTSGGERMGYGNYRCYLDSTVLIVTSMVTPLAVVLILNIFFFTSSVFQIYKIKKLQSSDMIKKSDRNNLYIYIKLSTMTGCFWFILLLAEGLNNDPLRYIAVIMNGLQGFFIFMSYVCNSRVWNIYKQCLLHHQEEDINSKGTLSQLASEVQA